MFKVIKYILIVFLSLRSLPSIAISSHEITPNNFSGSDIQRIRAAIDSAKISTHQVVIPRENNNGTNIWVIDSAILLTSNITVILNNCTIKLSDSSRDNMFRTDNIIIGAKKITWNNNISIIGVGNAILKGADNPRATGDAYRKLVQTPQSGRVSYGSDAEKPGRKQTGDWRNVMMLIAYVKGFTLKNVTMKNSHGWTIGFERTVNADISNIHFYLPRKQLVDGKMVKIFNRGAINLGQGSKYFSINNISGYAEDDFIALNNALEPLNPKHKIGDLNSTMITAPGWSGPQDDIAHITITNINCRTLTRAIAIRASGKARIYDIHINGVIAKTKYNNMLVGNKNYGKASLPERISNIYAMNLISNGMALILVRSPIANCVFMNGIYTGNGPSVIKYDIGNAKTENIKEINMVKVVE